MDALRSLADRREQLHEHHASSRPLSPDYELVGLAGEAELAKRTGLDIDASDRPAGDGGTDFAVTLTIDVKTARKPGNLIVERGKVVSSIYVLARYDDQTESAELLGWAWGAEMKARPVRDFGYGVLNHYLPARELKPMDSLDRLIGHATGGG
jgi:hypothetical protein